jgi:hypothetical protein
MSTANEPPERPPDRDPSRDARVAPVDPLDERLSAALDGEPTGPGSTPLDASAAERERDLAAARDLLAVPPAPLDDLTRRRLVRAALDASPTSSRSSSERALRWVRVGGVAAAVLAVIALSGWGLASLNQSSSKKGSETEAASGTTAPAGPVDLNEVSNPDVLKRRVEAALGVSIAPTGPTPTTALPNPQPTTESGRGTKSVPRCVATVRVPAGDTPELLGTATFHGTPALVVVAREKSRTLIFVVATAGCRLLSFQFLKR